MKKLKLIKFKSRVIYIENDIIDLSCGISFNKSCIDFEVVEGKEYEFDLTGDRLNEFYITLSHCITSVEWEEE